MISRACGNPAKSNPCKGVPHRQVIVVNVFVFFEYQYEPQHEKTNNVVSDQV